MTNAIPSKTKYTVSATATAHVENLENRFSGTNASALRDRYSRRLRTLHQLLGNCVALTLTALLLGFLATHALCNGAAEKFCIRCSISPFVHGAGQGTGTSTLLSKVFTREFSSKQSIIQSCAFATAPLPHATCEIKSS